jgi:RNA polymerase sigma-70 factor (ECF subfamily)
MAQVIGLAPPRRRGAARGLARRWRAFTWAGWRLGDKPADSGAHLTAEPQAPAADGSDASLGDTSPAADAEPVALPPGDFDAFIREHQRAILNYLWRMTGDEQSAYDLTQEVFVRSWRHFDKLRGYSSPRAWLFRVASNLAISSIRARRPLSSVDLLPSELQPASSDPAWRVVERDLVRAALDALPARRRAALTLREVYGLSTAEVARALGVSEAAARVTLSRAREQFRAAYLRERADGDEGQKGGDSHDA